MSQQKPAIPMKNLALFLVASIVIMFAWTYIENKYFKPKIASAKDKQLLIDECGGLLNAAAFGSHGLSDAVDMAALEAGRLSDETKASVLVKHLESKKQEENSPVVVARVAGRAAAWAVELQGRPRPQFIELGGEGFNLQVRFTTRGAGVDRLIVSQFFQADKYGHEVKHKINGKDEPQPLHLLPSPEDLPAEERILLAHDAALPSFLLYHYATPEDQRPEPLLGEVAWTLEPQPPPADADLQQVVFSTQLPDYGVKITKTFTLARHDYHVGLTLKIEKLPGKTPRPLRYQLTAGHGLPIEGVWYTSVFRNFITGLKDSKGTQTREIEDSATITNNLGSGRTPRGEGEIQYVACAGQYFVSALCVDNAPGAQKKTDFIAFFCATSEQDDHPKDKPQLGDICPRMISEALTLGDEPIEHKFVLYHGPLKVRQLYQFRNGSVADETVERYEKQLGLSTLTDFRSPTWIGRFASTIGWSDLTIAFTNLMHAVLGFLMRNLPAPWLAIIGLTILVRLCLMPLSRKQTATMQKMQEKMATLQPKLKELEERLKRENRSDELHSAKMKMMMENGVNPMAQMGGCLLMLAQMPIFMGLYYALQENVFFRLEPFLWINNLAAPDMLIWWGEKIPYISDPAHLGSFMYLGPYFNVLPILAVTLMIIQQKVMAPPAADDTQRQQQAMMKYMMILFALFFYKTPSGLVLYFIISSAWGLAERKLFPKKPLAAKPGDGDSGGNGARLKDKPEPPRQTWLQRKMREVMDAAEKKDNTTRRGPGPKKLRPR